MKKKLIIALVALGMTLGVSAQARWGVEAGVNIGHGFETNGTKAGFNMGMTGEFTAPNNWYMDGAIKLSSQPCGNTFDWGTEIASFHEIRNYTPYYLTLSARILGHSYRLSPTMNLTWSIGPVAGVGLFGRRHIKSVSYQGGQAETIRDLHSNNLFSHSIDGFSTSRFEAGASVRLSTTLLSHYRAGVEYNLLHIIGADKAIDNLHLFSINLGYVF